MARAKRKTGESSENEQKNDTSIDDDVDALFQLPLAEFTVARNALSARLKKGRYREEAERVKGLSKPPVSAWAVNQLYWKHQDAFKKLITIGERIRAAHASPAAGKGRNMRELFAERRQALSVL